MNTDPERRVAPEVVEVPVETPTPAVRELFGSAFDAVEEFARMLEAEGEVRGLIGPRELPRLWSRHIVNSAAVLGFLPGRGQVLDIGSGAGLPGIIVAVTDGDRVVLTKYAHRQNPHYALIAGFNEIGETLEEREAGKLSAVLERQLQALPQSVKGIASILSVAYEPVWAIGTGKVAGPAEIVEAHAIIRKALVATFGTEGNQIRILYGGSVKPDNANEILGLANVNGVLVGGASLQSKSFSQIVLA